MTSSVRSRALPVTLGALLCAACGGGGDGGTTGTNLVDGGRRRSRSPRRRTSRAAWPVSSPSPRRRPTTSPSRASSSRSTASRSAPPTPARRMRRRSTRASIRPASTSFVPAPPTLPATSRRGRRRWFGSAAPRRSRAASRATRAGSWAWPARRRSRRRPTGASSSPSRAGRCASSRTAHCWRRRSRPSRSIRQASAASSALPCIPRLRATAGSTSTRRARSAASRTTASAASPPPATSPRQAARSRSSTCRTCRAPPTTTAAACTSAPTASSTSASARTPTRAGAEPGAAVRQAAALQRGRHDPDRQSLLRHAVGPRPRRVGVRPAQSVHVRDPAGHRANPHQRRRRDDLGRDRCRRRRRELRLAGIGGPRQRRRRHRRAALRLQARRCCAARLGHGRILQGLRDRRRRVLPADGCVPRRLSRPVLLRRLRQPLRRSHRSRERQRGVCVRDVAGPAGRPARGHRRRGLRPDALRRDASAHRDQSGAAGRADCVTPPADRRHSRPRRLPIAPSASAGTPRRGPRPRARTPHRRRTPADSRR